MLARLSRTDFETSKWKFVRRVDIIGDLPGSAATVNLAYSDDDYQTVSSNRGLNVNNAQAFGMNFGRFQRRGWQLSYSGNNSMRWEALELRIRLGDS
jgi:hypothetical protein